MTDRTFLILLLAVSILLALAATRCYEEEMAEAPESLVRMAILEWPKRMRPAESRQVILQLPLEGASWLEPEQEDAEIAAKTINEPPARPGYDLYASATLSAGLNCVPDCNLPRVQRVQHEWPRSNLVWRWTVGPNPGGEGTHHMNVSAHWCWKRQPDDPCTAVTSNFFDQSFDVSLSGGRWANAMASIEDMAPLWALLTFSGPLPWSVVVVVYFYRWFRENQ